MICGDGLIGGECFRTISSVEIAGKGNRTANPGETDALFPEDTPWGTTGTPGGVSVCIPARIPARIPECISGNG